MIKVTYADLEEPEELLLRVSAVQDINDLRRELLMRAAQRLIEVNRRPQNWVHEVEVCLDFGLQKREQLRNEALDLARISGFYQEVFVDWEVCVALPVGSMAFEFRLRPESKRVKPAINKGVLRGAIRSRAVALKELRPCITSA